MSRKVLFVIHAAHPTAFDIARAAASGLLAKGIAVSVSDGDESGVGIAEVTASNDAAGCELVMVFGGDGTILRGIEIARDHDVPVFSVNLGHVGFLAEAEPEDIDAVINTVVNKEWSVEERTALAIHATDADGRTWESWALNEVAIEKYHREHMTKLLVSIDERPVSHWSCDGVLVATPTGSTAYAFSAGGPVVWPEVDALVLLPLAAHALFTRPMVISPRSEIVIDIESESADLNADGIRRTKLQKNDRVVLTSDKEDVLLAHIKPAAFADRLVAKFKLPVEGWRGE